VNDQERTELRAEIARMREAGLVGQSGRLKHLFDYLAERSLEGCPPKEAEIATDVFGRDASMVAEDSSVRVYVHRLRKRLEDFYLRGEPCDGPRLVLPRGEYCFQLEEPIAHSTPATDGQEPGKPSSRNLIRLLSGALAGAIVIIAILSANVWTSADKAEGAQFDYTVSPIWSPLADSSRPLILVVGDYYIFGEYEDGLFLTRLIRDFDISSREDLSNFLLSDPAGSQSYADVSLEYLPVSIAHAMSDFAPLLDASDARIVQASQLSPDALRCCDIIYIGLTSGFGLLQETVFAQSRFQLGQTFDEIVDSQDGTDFVSEAFLSSPGEAMYNDFAIFSYQEGPTGNHIWVFAGTRDTGLMGLSEVMMDDSWLEEELDVGVLVPGYEAVFKVTGQRQQNLVTRLQREHVPGDD
tara:strand:+ start:835 stop:2067 length:1233 start_codon:yes stop_codon:yes gene_type:complete